MQNFSIYFLYPWLLLLLIPAIGLTLFTHFRTLKRYRNTRNKIISIVLHTIVMTLAILILSGVQFHYDIRNDNNELMIVVDLSETQKNPVILGIDENDFDIEPDDFKQDNLIQTVLEECHYNNIKVGILGFGLENQCIAPLSLETDQAYDSYLRTLELLDGAAPSKDEEEVNIDTSATDIKAALLSAAEQFTHPETAKILLISDGYETDESAINAVRTLISLGVKVDVVSYGNGYEDDGIQITEVVTPDYYFKANENVNISITVNSRIDLANMRLEVYDNGEVSYNKNLNNIIIGKNVFNIPMVFSDDGLHEIKATITPIGAPVDGEFNNNYYKYIYMEEHNEILIIEQRESDSDSLMKILDSADYNVTRLNIATDPLTKTADDLRSYDQVILNNVSNADLENANADFVTDALNVYVKEYGGGLLTFGGKDDSGNIHSYNAEDMLSTPLQEMLPVRVGSYRPPLGTMFIGDFSGSMGSFVGVVRSAIVGCVKDGNTVKDGDFVGLSHLTDLTNVVLPLTAASGSNRNKIFEAANNMGKGITGGTVYRLAMTRAMTELNNCQEIANKHIVIFTDGMFFDNNKENFLDEARLMKQENYDITLTVVLMGGYGGSIDMIRQLTSIWGGKTYTYDGGSVATLINQLSQDLTSETISGYRPEDFNLIANERTSTIFRDVPFDLVSGEMETVFHGYYGSTAKSSADVLVTGKYKVPIYAQWKYGKGNVGCFMSDIYGEYSSDFLVDVNGIRLLENIISNVMPVENIRYSSISLSLNSNSDENYNYYNSLNVYHGELQAGEKLVGRVEYTDESGQIVSVPLGEVGQSGGECYIITAMDAANNYTQAEFILKDSGAYTVIVEKVDKDGKVIDSAEVYGSFAFSMEYDYYNQSNATTLLETIIERTGGQMIPANEGEIVIEGFIKVFHRSYDPRMLFFIIAMVCFLLDIAVRKFKFKWIHEIVRERKMMKEKK